MKLNIGKESVALCNDWGIPVAQGNQEIVEFIERLQEQANIEQAQGRKIRLDMTVAVVEQIGGDREIAARVYYPDEGSRIIVKKGLNTIELSEALFHELGHVIDWIISGDCMAAPVETREKNATTIGEALRWRKPTPEKTEA